MQSDFGSRIDTPPDVEAAGEVLDIPADNATPGGPSLGMATTAQTK